MRLQTHVNISTILSGIFQLGFIGTVEILPFFTRLPELVLKSFSDLPFFLFFTLLGSSLVDLDIQFFGAGHRLSSPFHKFELPLFFFMLSLSLAIVVPAEISPYPVMFSLLFLGWFFHLCGDFIQGGLGSLFVKGKIGIKSFKWKKYDNTPYGRFIDWGLGVLAIFFMFLTAVFSTGFLFTNSLTGKNFGLESYFVFLYFGVWMFFMVLGKNGCKNFIRRFSALVFLVVSCIIAYRLLRK